MTSFLFTNVKRKEAKERRLSRSDFDLMFVEGEYISLNLFLKSVKWLRIQEAILKNQFEDSRLINVKEIICLLIGYEDIFMINPIILSLISDTYPELNLKLQIGCISDLEEIGAAIMNGENIVQLLYHKAVNPQTELDSILATLQSKYSNPILERATDRFFKIALGENSTISDEN